MIGRSGGPLGNAYIEVFNPQIDASGEHYVPIFYYFPQGSSDSINQNSALVRPFRRALEEGKSIGKTTFVFHQENSEFFVLGSFAHTDTTGRTIFFPGLTFSRVIHTPDGVDLTASELHNIDHLTLEKNLRDWHITLSQKRTHGIRYQALNTKKVTNDVSLWFVMAIPDVNKLEPMPKIQEYKLKGPNLQALEKRAEIMLESREGGIFQVTKMSDSPPSPSFINFEFYVGNKREPDLPAGLFVLPPPLSELKEQIGQNNLKRSRAHDFPLDTVSLSIRVSKIRGSIKHDCDIVSGHEYAYP